MPQPVAKDQSHAASIDQLDVAAVLRLGRATRRQWRPEWRWRPAEESPGLGPRTVWASQLSLLSEDPTEWPPGTT
eukprot:1094985-Rhodomonas_salina.1